MYTHTSGRFALLLFMFFNAFGVMRASGQCTPLCSGGNVGIGSSFTPARALQVDGSIRIGLAGSGNLGELDFQNSAGNVFTFTTPQSMTDQKYTLPVAMPTGNTDQLICNTAGQLSWAASGSVSNAWLLTGNAGTNSAADYLGTQDNVDFVLRTSATERMRVLAGGNVGIGTSAPVATLHVHAMNGTSQLARYTVSGKSGSLTMTDPEATYYRPTISGISANGNVSALHLMANVLAADDDVADTKPMMVFESKRYSSGANIVNRPLFEWRNNQTARMTMLADGNLGIGTATPAQLLHLDATSGDTRLLIEKGSTNSGLIDFYQNTTHQASIGLDPVESLVIENYGNNEDIVFSVNDGGTQTDVMTIDGSTSRVGIGTSAPAYQLQLSTNSAGKPGDAEWTVVSDINYKTDIEPFEVGMTLIKQIDPISFRYTGELGLPSDQLFVGVSAQAMQEIAPSTVNTIEMVDTTDGTSHQLLSFNGSELKYVIINALKELSASNDSLRERTTLLENELSELMGLVYDCCSSQPQNRQSGSLPNKDAAKDLEFLLSQNDPNPFSSRTEIRYSIPLTIGSADLIIFDSSGKTINKYKLSEPGNGTVTIYGSEINSGLYYYSLVIDGKIQETKRMIHTK